MPPFILPLSDPEATLENVGGKGMSLAKLTRAGLPVPGGFHITTEAYRRFVSENAIQPRILQALKAAGQLRSRGVRAGFAANRRILYQGLDSDGNRPGNLESLC